MINGFLVDLVAATILLFSYIFVAIHYHAYHYDHLFVMKLYYIVSELNIRMM